MNGVVMNNDTLTGLSNHVWHGKMSKIKPNSFNYKHMQQEQCMTTFFNTKMIRTSNDVGIKYLFATLMHERHRHRQSLFIVGVCTT